MGFLEYIIPNEWVLRLIILFMWIVAGAVIRRMIKLRQTASANLAMLDKTEDVSLLEQSLLQNKVDYNELFAKYEASKEKTAATEVLFEHIRAIYAAGIKSSRLDADLLVKNSIDKIFSGVDFLKTSISLFLVIGILGTLVGLAISIGGFNGANFIMTGQASTSATATELSSLFGNLRGAFAPSMWGVFFTISFVFIYSWFIQEQCINRLTEKLTINTIRHWLPVLYPTDFQRSDNSIAKLNTTIKNAEGINKGVVDLQDNLDKSNATVKALSDMSDSIQRAARDFELSATKITDIQKLYDELRASNTAFNASLKDLVTASKEDMKESYDAYLKQGNDLQDKINALAYVMKEQNGVLGTVSEQLTSYNDTLLKNVNQIINAAQGTINAADKVMRENAETTGKSLDTMQQSAQTLKESAVAYIKTKDDLIRGVSEPVQKALEDNKQAVAVQLDSVAKSLHNIDGRMGESVKEISKMLESAYNNMEQLLAENKTNSSNDILKALHELNGNIQKLAVAKAVGGKMDPALLRSMMSQPASAAPVDSSDKLDEIIQQLKRANDREANRSQGGLLAQFKLPTLIIAALLLLSFIMQGVMVYRLSSLEKSQEAVNTVLLRGEMNDTGSGTQK